MTGEPTYIELGVPDVNIARTFFAGLLGWQPSGTDGPGNVENPSLHIGMHSDDPHAELLVFFAVDQLDDALTRLTHLGGEKYGEVRADPSSAVTPSAVTTKESASRCTNDASSINRP